MFLKVLSFCLPWTLRRRALNSWFGYSIHPTARIGFAWIFPGKLVMGPNTVIDHFTVAIHLDRIELERNANIGRSNWITGMSVHSNSPHFKHRKDRKAALLLKESASITKQHHLDCTDTITIGRFTTIAGYQSQFLTHSVDVYENRQDCAKIDIGDYAFVSTNVVVLGGAKLPAYSVLGAKSLLNKEQAAEWTLYGGVPAVAIKLISKEAKYFNRKDGFVW